MKILEDLSTETAEFHARVEQLRKKGASEKEIATWKRVWKSACKGKALIDALDVLDTERDR